MTYNLKLFILISSIKTVGSRFILAERSQNCSNFKGPKSTDEDAIIASSRRPRILRQAQTGSCMMAEPSTTMQVRRPVANAPVSILIRFDRKSGTLTGVWP